MEHKRRGCLLPLLVVLVTIAGLVAGAVAMHIPESFAALRLMKEAFDAEAMSGSVCVETAEQKLDASFYWCDLADERYSCISSAGMELYYHDEALYFDNGRGYDLEPLTQRIDEFEPALLLLAGFRRMQEEDAESFFLSVDTDWIEAIRRISPSAGAALLDFAGSQLTLTAHNGVLTEITLLLPDNIRASIRLQRDCDQTIPTDVLMEIRNRELLPLSSVEPLIRGCITLAQQDVFGADAALKVECGPLPISDTAQVYGTRKGLYLVRSGSVHDLSSGLDTGEIALALGWELCRIGVAESDNGITTYRLDVEGAVLQQVFGAVLSEIRGLGIDFYGGSLTVTVSDGIDTLSLKGSGNMPFLITNIPIQVAIQMEMMDGTIDLPEGIE